MIEDDRALDHPDLGLKGRLYGAAPVQAEGTLHGKAFYFRARHEEWTFAVAAMPDEDPVDIQYPHQGFLRSGMYDVASFIPFVEAEQIIRRCASEFLAEQSD